MSTNLLKRFNLEVTRNFFPFFTDTTVSPINYTWDGKDDMIWGKDLIYEHRIKKWVLEIKFT